MNVLDSALVRRVRQSSRLRPMAAAAYRAADRMIPAGDGPMVIANSMPKSGTHLLSSLIGQLPGMRFSGRYAVLEPLDRGPEGQWRIDKLDGRLAKMRRGHFMGGHLVQDPRAEESIRRHGTKLVTILRDPRAVVVSGVHYVTDTQHIPGRDAALEVFPTTEAMLKALVHGHGEPGDRFHFPDIGARFAAYADWLDSDVGIVVTFEDLVGAQGGGSDERQHDTVVRLLDYLGYGNRGLSTEEMAQQMFSAKSATFRKGRIDSWRDDLPADLAEEVLRLCRPVMDRLGFPA